MSRAPQDEQTFRVKRSLLIIVILTIWSRYSIDCDAFPPHGNPLVYNIAMTWLVTIAIAIASSGIFSGANPKIFALADWENEGKIYDLAGIRAFRWVVLHSPLGCINPNFHLRATRADCDRLLRLTNVSEGVHWLTCVVSVMLAIWFLLIDYAVYGYVMLLARIPFDLYPIMLQRWNRGRVLRVLERPRLRTPS